MCGIGGFFISPESTLFKDGGIRTLENFTVELLKNLETHGREASGLAITRSDGVKVFKQPVRSSKLVELKSFKDFIRTHLTPTTISVIVHTRLPTVGDKSNNDNNHPVIHGNVVGIHNGHISNHAELFSKIRVKRIGEVDSEVIFALLNLAWDHEVKSSSKFRDVDYSDALVKTAPALKGSFAFAAVNARFPNRLGLVKSGGNCVIVQKFEKEKEKMISFATSIIALEKAGKTSGLWNAVKNDEYEFLTENSVLNIKIGDQNEIEIWERSIGG